MREPLPLGLYLELCTALQVAERVAEARELAAGHRAWMTERGHLTLLPAPLRPNTSRALTHEGHTALRFARCEARASGATGPMFARYWTALQALVVAESRAMLRHEREGDCDLCPPGCRSAHECSEARRRPVWEAERALRIASALYESERRPPAEGASFYVTALREGDREPALLAGPYPGHEAALEVLPEVRRLAHQADPLGWTYAYGTTAVSGVQAPGSLNHLLAP